MIDEQIIKAFEWCEQFENNVILVGKSGGKYTLALQTMQIIKQVLKDYNRQKAEIERLEDKLYFYEKTKHEVLHQFTRKLHEELELLKPAHFLDPFQETMPITEVARLVDRLLHIVCMEVIHSVASNEFIKDMKEDGILPVKEMTEQKG